MFRQHERAQRGRARRVVAPMEKDFNEVHGGGNIREVLRKCSLRRSV